MRIGWGTFLGSLTLCGLMSAPQIAEARRTVYLNFDQQAINNANGNDPSMDSYSSTGFTPGTTSGWPGLSDEARAELIYLMKEATVPFDIAFVTVRPGAGTYDMLVFGTDTDANALFQGLNCSAAISLGDCDDGNAENISFMFYGCLSDAHQMNMSRVGFNALKALGFGWGLENVTASGQVMGNYTPSALEFGDQCATISNGNCTGHIGCAANQQNSTTDLMSVVGARVDDGQPAVTITSPQDGETIAGDFSVLADVDDLFGGLTVTLEIVDTDSGKIEDTLPPYAWPVQLPAGMWTLRVEATDADGNLTSQETTVCVDNCEGTTTGASDESTGGEESGTGTTGTGTTTGVVTTGPVTDTGPYDTGSVFGDSPDKGCGCRSDRGSGGLFFSLALLALIGRAPRRGRPS